MNGIWSEAGATSVVSELMLDVAMRYVEDQIMTNFVKQNFAGEVERRKDPWTEQAANKT